MRLKIQEIAHHRNGVGGDDFYAVRFRDGKNNMLATVFASIGQCAVICLDLIPQVGVTFGFNSWRGDTFEDTLRAAIAAWEDARTAAFTKGQER